MMKLIGKIYMLVASMIALGLSSSAALALDTIGIPKDRQIGFQEPVTQVMKDIDWLHDFLMIIMTVICIFVFALLGMVWVKFRKSKNATPARFTHNTALEVAWTTIPIIILIVIGIPSIKLLYLQEDHSDLAADMVIKATGNQWYWSYEYPDEGIEFDAVMLGAGVATYAEAKEEMEEYGLGEAEWKLATDNAVYVPVNTTVQVLVTGADVIHAWAVPAFGSKVDAMPGRTNYTWFNAEKEGIYYGQCSELCGKDHAYMPITVKVVSQEEYDAWVVKAKVEFASDPAPALQLAAD